MEEGEHCAEVVLTPPLLSETEGDETLKIEEQLLVQQTVKSAGPFDRIYLINQLKDLTFDYEGEWQLSVLVDGGFVGEIGLHVAG